MSNVSAWSQTAASNNSSSPNGWPENMAPSGVNDSARENMAALAKWYACLDGSLTTTGSANAYVLTTGSSHAALADIGTLVFKANFATTGAATLAVDGLAAKSIYFNGAATTTDTMLANTMYSVVYNATGDVFDLISPGNVDLTALNTPLLSTRTSDTILASGDLGKIVKVTSGTFTQTITAAATLTNGWFCYYWNAGTGIVTLDPNSTETINGASTLAVPQDVVYLLQSDGTNINAVPLGHGNTTNLVEVHTGNGHGSTNTAIRRFTTALTETGSAITYADSAANGATFTINQDGIYSISYSDFRSGASSVFGVTRNSAELTTNLNSITTPADRLTAVHSAGNFLCDVCTWTGRLSATDVIRAHTNANPDGATDDVFFRIQRISP